jgi:VanZ family protein
VLLILVLVGILTLSLWPKPPQIPGFQLSDKIGHFIAYIFLGACALAAAERRRAPELLVVIVSCSLFGGIIEIVQPMVGRSRELGDFMVDLAGSALGAGIVFIIRILSDARKRRPPRSHSESGNFPG